MILYLHFIDIINMCTPRQEKGAWQTDANSPVKTIRIQNMWSSQLLWSSIFFLGKIHKCIHWSWWVDNCISIYTHIRTRAAQWILQNSQMQTTLLWPSIWHIFNSNNNSSIHKKQCCSQIKKTQFRLDLIFSQFWLVNPVSSIYAYIFHWYG